MRTPIIEAIEDAVRAIEFLKKSESLDFIESATLAIVDCFRAGNKLLIAGNGGSMCDALHFAEELTAQFRGPRRALPAIALSEQGFLTAVGNDMGFERVFSRGVEALGNPGDIFIGLTTSGNSQNLIRAVQVAKEKKLKTISFLGKTGGPLKGQSDLEWIVPGFTYSDRIQEAHMTAIHIIIEQVESLLFASEKVEDVLV